MQSHFVVNNAQQRFYAPHLLLPLLLQSWRKSFNRSQYEEVLFHLREDDDLTLITDVSVISQSNSHIIIMIFPLKIYLSIQSKNNFWRLKIQFNTKQGLLDMYSLLLVWNKIQIVKWDFVYNIYRHISIDFKRVYFSIVSLEFFRMQNSNIIFKGNQLRQIVSCTHPMIINAK